MIRLRSCRVIYYFDTPALGRRHQSFGRVIDQLMILEIPGEGFTIFCIISHNVLQQPSFYCFLPFFESKYLLLAQVRLWNHLLSKWLNKENKMRNKENKRQRIEEEIVFMYYYLTHKKCMFTHLYLCNLELTWLTYSLTFN